MTLPPPKSQDPWYHPAVLTHLAEGLHLTTVSDGIIVYTNPTLDRMFGYERGELVGRPVATLNAPTSDRSPDEVAAEIITALAERGAWAGELQNITKQGELLWCRANVSSFDHPDFGKVWISVHEDVTDRKRAEALVRASEERLRLITDHLPAFIAYVDRDLRYQFVNRSHPALVGRTREEVIGARVIDIMGEEFFSRAGPHLHRALAGERVSYEIALASEPEATVVASEYVPDVDERGEVRGIYFLGSDITKRKRAEHALRAREAQHRTIIQTAMDGFWLVDAEGRLLQVNDTYCRMSGYSAEELSTMTVADVEVQSTTFCLLDMIQSGTPPVEARVECRHRRKDGSTFEVEASVQYRPTEGGRYVAFLRDLTERKHAERERKRLESLLEQARKMEAVGQLASGIAHDFNNILMTVTLQLECLGESIEAGEGEVPSVLQEALSSLHRAADFTKQILLFSRSQAMKSTRYEPGETVANLAASLARMLGERVRLKVVKSDESTWIDGDVGMFEQVVTNLVLNARDAMPDGGGVTIEIFPTRLDERIVRGRTSAPPGQFVCVRVADTGTGMSPEIVSRIFEPFFTTKQFGKVTGLGLAIVHGIVTRHRGFVDVESGVNGTAFSVFFPGSAPPSSHPAAPRPGSLDGLAGHERVLVVEDEPVLRKLIVGSLARLGYRTSEACDAFDALSLAEGQTFDLLLTDMAMPGGMSGLHLSNELMGRDPRLKVIILSGHATTALEDAAAGAAGIVRLAKPCGMGVLLDNIRKCLDRSPDD